MPTWALKKSSRGGGGRSRGLAGEGWNAKRTFSPSEFLQLNLVIIIRARKRRLVDVFITLKFLSKQPYFYVYLPEMRVVWPPSSLLRDGQEESAYLSPHCSFCLCFLAKLQPDKRGRRLSPPYMSYTCHYDLCMLYIICTSIYIYQDYPYIYRIIS